MNQRTKILAGLFGTAILYAIASGVAYPRWIKPLLIIDRRIAEKRAHLDRLQQERELVQQARYDYRAWVGRLGTFDEGRVVTDIRDRINTLIETHKLRDAKTVPGRFSVDRKTQLKKSSISVTGDATLEAAVGFLRDLAELPQLVRVSDVHMSPVGSARRGLSEDQLSLRVGIDVWVLPQHPVVGRLEPPNLERSEAFVRHAGRDYSPIWSGEPFSEYVALQVTATPSLGAHVHQPASLSASATGGTPPYTFQWTPAEGLTGADTANPKVDTSTPASRRYTVTVSDARSHSTLAHSTVSITEVVKPPEVVKSDPAPQPPPVHTGPKRWPDGRSMQMTMALLRSRDSARHDELLICDLRNKQTSFYGVGAEFDGGELVFVHQTGGLVRRKDAYFVYPLGETLDRDIPVEQATDFPDLQAAAFRHKLELQHGFDSQRSAVSPAMPETSALMGPDAEDDRQGDSPTARVDKSGAPEQAPVRETDVDRLKKQRKRSIGGRPR